MMERTIVLLVLAVIVLIGGVIFWQNTNREAGGSIAGFRNKTATALAELTLLDYRDLGSDEFARTARDSPTILADKIIVAITKLIDDKQCEKALTELKSRRSDMEKAVFPNTLPPAIKRQFDELEQKAQDCLKQKEEEKKKGELIEKLELAKATTDTKDNEEALKNIEEELLRNCKPISRMMSVNQLDRCAQLLKTLLLEKFALAHTSFTLEKFKDFAKTFELEYLGKLTFSEDADKGIIHYVVASAYQDKMTDEPRIKPDVDVKYKLVADAYYPNAHFRNKATLHLYELCETYTVQRDKDNCFTALYDFYTKKIWSRTKKEWEYKQGIQEVSYGALNTKFSVPTIAEGTWVLKGTSTAPEEVPPYFAKIKELTKKGYATEFSLGLLVRGHFDDNDEGGAIIAAYDQDYEFAHFEQLFSRETYREEEKNPIVTLKKSDAVETFNDEMECVEDDKPLFFFPVIIYDSLGQVVAICNSQEEFQGKELDDKWWQNHMKGTDCEKFLNIQVPQASNEAECGTDDVSQVPLHLKIYVRNLRTP